MVSLSSDPKFVGKPFEIETAVVERKSSLLDFKCYTLPGMVAYRDTGERPLDPAKLKPITRKEDLKAGDVLLFDWPHGGYMPVTVEPGCLFASSEALNVSLEFHEGWPEAGIGPQWLGSCFMNNRAVARCSFV